MLCLADDDDDEKKNLRILPLFPFRLAFVALLDLWLNIPWGPVILQLCEYLMIWMDPGLSPETIASTFL